MTLTLTFLGTGAAIPSLDRNVASLALAREGETLLFDCGEGTQRQMMRYGVSFSVRTSSSRTSTPTTCSA
jgi:ribonuclease Z